MGRYKIVVGELCIDVLSRHVYLGSRLFRLSDTEFWILTYLALQGGVPATGLQIASAVSKKGIHPSVPSIKVHIQRLRVKFGCEYLPLNSGGVGYVLNNPEAPFLQAAE